MNIPVPFVVPSDPLYPDSDGAPIAENTLQFEWIVTLVGNLDGLFANHADVFVAGDLLWYPVEGRPDIRRAPDALVAFGRPRGRRGSYRQWLENHVAPQVVFEVLSPGNRAEEMEEKFLFYNQYGVGEYYVWDPDEITLEGWLRSESGLEPIPVMDGWTSPLLGVRFELAAQTLRLSRPNGEPFRTFAQLDEGYRTLVLENRAYKRRVEEAEREKEEAERRAAEAEREKAEALRQAEADRRQAEASDQRAAAADQRAAASDQRAAASDQRAEEARQLAERLAARLSELGVDPEALGGDA
jgi:Uma2 family endonuclease